MIMHSGVNEDGSARECVFFGVSRPQMVRLSDVIGLDAPQAKEFWLTPIMADAVGKIASYIEGDQQERVPQCLYLLALEVERHFHSVILSHTIGAQRREPTAKRWKQFLRRIDGASSPIVAQCWCRTCAKRRYDPLPEWEAPEAPLDDGAAEEDMLFAERAPVPLAEVSMPAVKFVATLDPEQRVRVADGRIMRAAEFMREVETNVLTGAAGRSLIVRETRSAVLSGLG